MTCFHEALHLHPTLLLPSHPPTPPVLVYTTAPAEPKPPDSASHTSLNPSEAILLSPSLFLTTLHSYENLATYRNVISNAGSLTANSSPSANNSLSFRFKFDLVASSSPAGVE